MENAAGARSGYAALYEVIDGDANWMCRQIAVGCRNAYIRRSQAGS